MKKTKTPKINPKDFYAFGKYKPNKNAVPVVYKGTEYLSKAQCMALEGITRKELDAYLKGIEPQTPTPEAPEVEEVDEDLDEVLEEDEEENELPNDYFDVEDDF